MYFLQLCFYCVYGQMSEIKNYYYYYYKVAYLLYNKQMKCLGQV